MEPVDPSALLVGVTEKRDLRNRKNQEPDRARDRPPPPPERNDRPDDNGKLAGVDEERSGEMRVQRSLTSTTDVSGDRKSLPEHAQDDHD